MSEVPEVPIGAAFFCDQPGCDREFTTPQALGRHKAAKHGIAGTSAGAVSKRAVRGSVPGKGPAPTRPPRSTKKPKQDEALIVLDVLCPKGIPVPHLDAVNTWVEQTRALLKLLRG